nr:DUF819 family protein [Hyphomonas sp. Mor2]
MPSDTLIASSDIFGVLTTIMLIVACGMAMERHPKIGQLGAMFVILMPALLTALSILPRESAVYALVNGPMIALAIPMLLFNANLKKLWRQSGRVMIAFLLAVAATIFAAIIGALFVNLGSNESTWVGLMTAAFIGGAVNLAAVAGAMEVVGDPKIGLIFASVYVVIIPYFIFLMMLPSLGPIWRLFAPSAVEDAKADLNAREDKSVESESNKNGALGVAIMVALAGVCVVLGEVLARATAMPALKFLGLSLVAIAIATFCPRLVNRMDGHNEMGHILIYAFLGVMGAAIDFSVVSEEGLPIIVFVIILLAVHLVVVSLIGRVLKLSGPELLIASNACILGPPTAAAMATARGWSGLVTPGILVGVFGWAIASFVGVGLAIFL